MPSFGSDSVHCTVDDERIDESSGLAVSTRDPSRLWTHNDSGDTARLFALGAPVTRTVPDGRGPHHAGVDAFDAEDLAPGPNSTLWLADIGDNIGQRQRIVLDRVTEPQVSANAAPADWPVPAQRFRFAYPDGPHDAEALLVGAAHGTGRHRHQGPDHPFPRLRGGGAPGEFTRTGAPGRPAPGGRRRHQRAGLRRHVRRHHRRCGLTRRDGDRAPHLPRRLRLRRAGRGSRRSPEDRSAPHQPAVAAAGGGRRVRRGRRVDPALERGQAVRDPVPAAGVRRRIRRSVGWSAGTITSGRRW